ncbi:hypothetical protein [Nibricoccus sp. IMCC34717]|uniref:hypothetical protein n=1 Tax=Nibricoccus sp. IMCC34717 TaxID=3034021 RepID=UPI00384D1A21
MRTHRPLLLLALLSPFACAAVPADYAGKPFSDEFHGSGAPAIPGIVECALYDLGGEGVACHDTTRENEGSGVLNRQSAPYNHMRAHGNDYIWHFREQEPVDISYVKDWADLNHPNPVTPPINHWYLGWAADGEWTNYTVTVATPGVYTVKCLYSYAETEITRRPDGTAAAGIWFELNGQKAADVTLPRSTGGWHTWDYGQIATITFPEAGPQLLTFHYRRGNNWAYWVFERISDLPPNTPVSK